MSNKTQLQTNNTTLASLTETLRSKAVSGGEDVTSETNAYTTKLTTLETAITALETELQGKASGGSGANFETSVVTLNIPVSCQYLGIDFQPKTETTSTFETVKNSIVFIAGTWVGGSGYAPLPSRTGVTIGRLTDTIVNITIATSGGAD